MQSSLSAKQLWLLLYFNFFVSVQKLLASDVRKFHLNSIANRLKMIDLEYFKNNTLRIHGLDKIEVNDSYPIKIGLRRYYDFIEQSSTERNQKNNNEWFLEGEMSTMI